MVKRINSSKIKISQKLLPAISAILVSFALTSCEAPGNPSSNSGPLVANLSSGTTGLPSPPTGVVAAEGSSVVSLSWNQSSGGGDITYTIKRSTDDGSGYTVIASQVTSTQYVDKTVVNSNTYYYVIAATNNVGTSADSLQVSATPNQPEVSFTSPNNNSFINVKNQKSFLVEGYCSPQDSTVRISGTVSASVQCMYTKWSKYFDFSNLEDTASENVYTLFADLTDGLGNPATQAVLTLKKATITPSLTIQSPLSGSYANSNNYTSFTVNGNCSANGRTVNVQLFSGMKLVTPNVQPTCSTSNTPNWQTTFDLTGLSSLITISASYTDIAGNGTTTAPVLITKNTSTPAISLTTPIVGSYINVKSNTSSYTIAGNCDQNSSPVTFKVDGSVVSSSGGICNGSTFSGTIDVTTIADNSQHLISGTISNVAGNSNSSSVLVLKDATPPVVTVNPASSIGAINLSNVASYTLSGTCNADNRKVGIIAAQGSTQITTATTCDTSANPNWTTIIPGTSTFGDGTVSFAAIQTDDASNTTTSSYVVVLKNTVAPTVAITSPSANSYINSINNSETFPISGTCSATSQLVTLKLNGAKISSQSGGLCNGSTFSATMDTLSLSEDTSYTLAASITDNVGNTTESSSILLTKSTLKPVVVISSPTSEGYINISNKSEFTVSGACSLDGYSISIKAANAAGSLVTSTKTCSASSSPNWSTSFDLSSFNDGTISFIATQMDTSGNIGTSNVVSVSKNTIAPTVSISSPSSHSYINILNNNSSYSVTGACSANSQLVSILVDGLNGVNQAGGNCINNTFAATIDTTTLTESSHLISAVISDSTKNYATSASVSITKDITPPVITVSNPIPNFYINILNNSASFPVSGSCSDSLLSVSIQIDGSAAKTQANGSCTGMLFSTTFDSTQFSEGTHSLSAVLLDAAGNATTSSSLTFTKKTVAPIIAITSPVPNTYINAQTNSATYPVSGTCNSSSQSVSIQVDGSNSISQAYGICDGSTFSTTLNSTALSEGNHTFNAIVADSAGNSGTSASIAVNKATMAPGITITSPSNGGYINAQLDSSTYTVSGSCSEANQTVTLMLDGSQVSDQVGGTCASNLFSITLNTTSLSETTHTFTASISSVAGNTATSSAIGVTKDITFPTIAINSPSDGSSINASTNSSHFTVSGTCSEASKSVTLQVNGSAAIGESSSTCNGSTFVITFDSTSYIDGTYSLSAVISDSAKNTTTSISNSIFKKATIPTLAFANPTLLSIVNLSNQSSFSISGSCSENGRTVAVIVTDGNNVAIPTENPICNTASSPNFNLVVDLSSLSDGLVTFAASEADSVGNSGSASSVIVKKDTVPPTIAISSPNNGSYANISNYSAFSLTGTCSESSTSISLSIFDGTNTITSSTTPFCSGSTNPSWSAALNLSALNDGAISITATPTDSAQNIGTAVSLNILKDTQAPVLAITTPATDGGQVGDLVQVSGDCTEDSAAVTLSAIGSVTFITSTTCSTSESPQWSTYLNLSSLNDGNISLYATQVDSGDNKGISPVRTVSKNSTPIITAPNDQVYTLTESSSVPLIQGTTAVITATVDSAGNTNSFTSCTFQTLGLSSSDSNYAPEGTPCNSLPSLTTSNSVSVLGVATFVNKSGPIASGSLTWTPTFSQRGSYKFTLGATNQNNSSQQTFYVTVREAFTTNNLLAAFDATVASDSSQYSGIPFVPRSSLNNNNDRSNWFGLVGSELASLSSFGSSSPWTGTGATSISSLDPYALSFNSMNSDRLSLSSILSGYTKVLFSVWAAPSSSSSLGRVIATNADNSSNGFILRQSNASATAGKVEVLGNYTPFVDQVMTNSPVAYFRLDESSGTSALDSSGNGNTGTYSGTIGMSQESALTGDSDSSIQLDGSTGLVTVSNLSSFSPDNTLSLSAWIKTTNSSEQYILTKAEDSFLLSTGLNSDGKVCLMLNNVTSSPVCGSTIVSDGSWHFILASYDGNTIVIYVDGVSDYSGSFSGSLNSGSSAVYIGARSSQSSTGYFSGMIDEVALYNSALNSSQVLAQYNSNSKVICRSSSTLSDSSYSMISILFSGSTSQLFINGKSECKMSTQSSYSASSSQLMLGATNNGTQAWSGKVSDIKVFGTINSTPGNSTTVYSDFIATANRFRATPIENISTTNLAFSLDAANASFGLRSYSNGCSSNQKSWFNLGSSLSSASLSNFNDCESSTFGWQGSGVSSSPYSLVLNGSSQSVSVDSISSSSFSKLTLSAWIKPINLTHSKNTLFALDNDNLLIYLNSEGSVVFNIPSNYPSIITSSAKLTANTWNHIAITYDTLAKSISFYINGTLDSTQTYAVANTPILGSSHIGASGSGSNNYFNGNIGTLSLYSRSLSSSEVKQNCLAQQSRFGISSCATK